MDTAFPGGATWAAFDPFTMPTDPVLSFPGEVIKPFIKILYASRKEFKS